MAHLHATFRTLVSLNLPLAQIVERTSRMFCESTLPAHFATLACGKAGSEGELEICNAGHTHPFLVRGATIERVVSTGLPLGMFCEEQFAVRKAHMNPGDTILLYTDGLSEALNEPGLEYGTERLSDIVQSHHDLPPAELISICVEDLKTYRAGTPMGDDLTIMAVRRSSL
jgi:sigma-B regulation protein RsbU (phosphoserine phosphatase)